LFVKYEEIFSPRAAISAISSAPGIFLDIFGIALFLLPGGLPCGNQVITFPPGVPPDFEDHRAKMNAAPSDCAKLFRTVILLVDNVSLIEDLLRFLQADAALGPSGPPLPPPIYNRQCARKTGS
jgi:hypothetical protein